MKVVGLSEIDWYNHDTGKATPMRWHIIGTIVTGGVWLLVLPLIYLLEKASGGRMTFAGLLAIEVTCIASVIAIAALLLGLLYAGMTILPS